MANEVVESKKDSKIGNVIRDVTPETVPGKVVAGVGSLFLVGVGVLLDKLIGGKKTKK
jgi:hypothetical protein